jgi:hypothetical protein
MKYIANKAKLHIGSLLGLFFDPEDGGYIYLGNFRCLSMDYTPLHAGNRTLHDHRRKNLKVKGGVVSVFK